MRAYKKLFTIRVIASSFLLLLSFSCAKEKTESKKGKIRNITGMTHLTNVIAQSGNRLLLFDLYADWCGPCRMLAPILEEIAEEYSAKADIYKIDTDAHSDIASAFQVRGIPFVVFMQNQKVVYTLTGLHPKGTYAQAIEKLSPADTVPVDETAHGSLIKGERVIRMAYGSIMKEISVYRGDTVKIIIEELTDPMEISIPAFSVRAKAEKGQDLTLSFKAENTGIFEMYCNGKCPENDGSQVARIIVMQYKSAGKASFSELSAGEAQKLIQEKKPFILDVRTPSEFYSGYIPGAILIPLQQLEGRLSELAGYKDKDVLVYCRSGNRSTVAAKILIENGFTRLYNLRPGINGWIREKLPVTK